MKGEWFRFSVCLADSVPNLEWGDREASQRRVDLILSDSTRYLVVKVQMELLEICSNLVSSIRHNRFERHFDLG